MAHSKPAGATAGIATGIAAERNPLTKAGKILGPGFMREHLGDKSQLQERDAS